MALMDKMKAQAATIAQKAQEAGKAGQAKIEEVQAKRRADGMLRQLGLLTYKEMNGASGPDAQSQVDSLVAELKPYEAEFGPLTNAPADGDAA